MVELNSVYCLECGKRQCLKCYKKVIENVLEGKLISACSFCRVNFKNYNNKERIERLKYFADKKEAWAQHRLGNLYKVNNKDEAYKYYNLAAEQNYPYSQYEIGYYYKNVEKDLSPCLFLHFQRNTGFFARLNLCNNIYFFLFK